MTTRIYLVEDHQMLRDGLKLVATHQPGWEIVGEAGDLAEAALAISTCSAIDVLLTDYRLPDGDGLSLIGGFRRKFPNGKVVVLSGTTTRAFVRSALIGGADGFVAKEDGADEITRAVRMVVSGETFLSTRAASVVAEAIKHTDLSPVATLSKQELVVLRGIALGRTYKEIAIEMGISAKSVETYRARLAAKTGVRTKAQLARFAAANDLVA